MFVLGRGQVRAESSTEAFKLLTGVVPLHSSPEAILASMVKQLCGLELGLPPLHPVTTLHKQREAQGFATFDLLARLTSASPPFCAYTLPCGGDVLTPEGP